MLETNPAIKARIKITFQKRFNSTNKLRERIEREINSTIKAFKKV
jgi:hypothetical protein